MLDSLLDQLARQRGIGDAYHNWRGDLVWVSSGTKRAILRAMGLPTDDATAVERALQERETERWRALLPPVAVVHPGRHGVVIAGPAAALGHSLDWRVVSAGGTVVSGSAGLAELREIEHRELDGTIMSRRELTLPATLEYGYHSLQVTVAPAALRAECALIVAPTACFEPQALQAGRRLWGVAVQLYTLRSQQNWGIGDFVDLAEVVRQCSRYGAAFIGLNPLHALFPGNPWQFSPYSPSSRHFLNVMYIAVERVAEFDACAAARAHVAQPAFQAELARLRATAVVDYPGVARVKLHVLRLLHAQFRAAQTTGLTPRGRQFRAYIEERGESLRRHALHDALDMHLRAADDSCWGWPVWPEQFLDPAGAGVAGFEQAHAAEVEFHAWLQWLADEQLGAAQALARELGMPIGLYGDYAVGVNPSGSETWSDQALYRKGAGVGAPPDALALKGQDWGIPPQDPNALIAAQYRPFRQLVAANMRHFGALRLDHVMALFRQWWVPVGLGSTEGGYVHYPVDDLMSVLALESERHGCLVVGEDLGTVPPEISHAMAERAVYSYRVLLFEKHADGRFKTPAEFPRRAIATITTHDLPTLNGYWSASDVALRQRLDLYPSDEMHRQVLAERVRDRHALLAALAQEGLAVPDSDGSDASYGVGLSRAVHDYLARTASALVILQAEDLVGMPDPVNVPGTSDEHANWQRKMSVELGDLFADPSVTVLLRQIEQSREL